MSTFVEISKLPTCDFHPKRLAAFDGKTKMGPWAYMCPPCFKAKGLGIGTGKGQRLVVPEP